MNFLKFLCPLLVGICLASSSAEAYLGPLVGMPVIGSLLALMWSSLIAVIMVLLWPARLVYKHFKARKKSEEKLPHAER